ncbi:hypothetical protein [Streptomyces sp. G1]|uniref:hypothetical protein n=1 Tax=Streptomyces sp. G1 TaxID=361572 RepID=UPI00202F42CD|nr:hypothetical protein [Streptomyces sp. G1]MCM1965711.1 hypothetical protein [Streptomyces sp. G1]
MDLIVIKHAVEANDGMARLSMGFVKKKAAPDRARLSAEFCAEISKELDKMGIITLPRRLPTSENDFVCFIDKESALGHVVAVAAAIAALDAVGANPLPDLFKNYALAKGQLTV